LGCDWLFASVADELWLASADGLGDPNVLGGGWEWSNGGGVDDLWWEGDWWLTSLLGCCGWSLGGWGWSVWLASFSWWIGDWWKRSWWQSGWWISNWRICSWFPTRFGDNFWWDIGWGCCHWDWSLGVLCIASTAVHAVVWLWEASSSALLEARLGLAHADE